MMSRRLGQMIHSVAIPHQLETNTDIFNNTSTGVLILNAIKINSIYTHNEDNEPNQSPGKEAKKGESCQSMQAMQA